MSDTDLTAATLHDQILLAGRDYVDALEEELRADEAVAQLRAHLCVDLRRELERQRPLSRVTDQEIELHIRCHPKLREAKERALVATVERVRAESEREAIRTQRDLLLTKSKCGD
jgi:hypothetical protein